MPRFSANLGFLWTELPLPQAIRSAKAAGFHAVECHDPYNVPPKDVNAALSDTGFTMIGINTIRAGGFGLAAMPGQEDAAQDSIQQAIDYAAAIKAQCVHVLAGVSDGTDAHDAYMRNLAFACELAAPRNITILIEPLNQHDVPGYFLRTNAQAKAIIDDLGASNLKLMFDCYHVGKSGGDVVAQLRDMLPIIGHIQFASVPDRGAPDQGDVDYARVFAEIARLEWKTPLGAEYRPAGKTENSLNWLNRFQ